MGRNRVLTAVAAVSLLTLLLAGCGSSTKRLAKPDFIKKLDALCKTRENSSKFLDNDNIFNLQTGAKDFTKAKGVLTTFLDGEKALKPPKDLDKVMSNYNDTGDRALSTADDLVAAAKAGNQKLYSQLLLKLINTTSAADKTLNDHGTKACYSADNAPPPPEKPAAGAATVDVGAKEYQFTLPSSISAGKTAFKLTNHGNELHVLGISQIKAGHTFQELQQFVTTSNDDPNQKGLTEDVAVGAFTAPDGSNFVNADLKPGTYAVFCFISAQDGTPHYKKGMLAQFTVR